MKKILFLSSLILLLCSPAWSATQLKKTVCPSGCDYTALETCMNANEQNLVTADQYFDVEISGTWSSADTTAVTIHNYTTDATRYINIYTTGDALHDGREAAVSGRSNYILKNDINVSNGSGGIHLYIHGLEIGLYTNGFSRVVALGTGWAANHIEFFNNIVHDVTRCAYGAVNYRGENATAYIYNNLVYNNGVDDYGAGIKGGANTIIYNNTVYNNGSCTGQGDTYGWGISGGGTVKNNISVNNGGACPLDFYNYTGSASKNYNISSDASIGGANDIENVTVANQFVSITAGAENFHLKSGADAIAAGTDLSGTFTTDIDGDTRSGTWDIGADEYVSTATARRFFLIQ